MVSPHLLAGLPTELAGSLVLLAALGIGAASAVVIADRLQRRREDREKGADWTPRVFDYACLIAPPTPRWGDKSAPSLTRNLG